MTSAPSSSMLARLLGLANRLSHVAVWAGGALTLASVLLITFDLSLIHI